MSDSVGKLYTKDGWINWEYIINQGCAFNMIVGARGTGKTYGLMKELLDRGEPFIYLRRLKTQIDSCGKMSGNPFKRINIDTGRNIAPFNVGGNIEFRENDRTGNLVAVGVALSTVATVRGIDFSDLNYIVFDEAVAMISFSMSSGRDASSSSARLGIAILIAVTAMTTLMTHEAIGSSIVHSCPRMIAPPIPMSEPIEERASLLWCHAFAMTTVLLVLLPTFAVHWYRISFAIMDTTAAIRAM